MELTSIYGWGLWVGFGGLLAMTLMGASHFGHGHGHSHGGAHSGHAGHGHAGHGHIGHGSHVGHGHSGHAANTHSGQGHASAGREGSAGFSLLGLVSPRLWFSVMVGFGATGLLLKAFLHEPLLLMAAVAGGLLGEWLLFGRIWNIGMKFASQPARTLESAVAEEARATTNFDATGSGVVAIELDGRMIQILGELDAKGQQGLQVRAGDRLFVEDVDSKRGRCTVSRLD